MYLYLFYIVITALPSYKDCFTQYLTQKDPLPVAGKLFEHGIITQEEVARVAECTDYKEGETFLLNAVFGSVDNEKLKRIELFLKTVSKQAEPLGDETNGKCCIIVS